MPQILTDGVNLLYELLLSLDALDWELELELVTVAGLYSQLTVFISFEDSALFYFWAYFIPLSSFFLSSALSS